MLWGTGPCRSLLHTLPRKGQTCRTLELNRSVSPAGNPRSQYALPVQASPPRVKQARWLPPLPVVEQTVLAQAFYSPRP